MEVLEAFDGINSRLFPVSCGIIIEPIEDFKRADLYYYLDFYQHAPFQRGAVKCAP